MQTFNLPPMVPTGGSPLSTKVFVVQSHITEGGHTTSEILKVFRSRRDAEEFRDEQTKAYGDYFGKIVTITVDAKNVF